MDDNIQSLATRFVNSRNESDFKLLYERVKPGILMYVTKMLKDQDAAEDVVADAFVKMWSKIDQYNPYWNFSTWAYKIAKNEAMQWVRKNGNVHSLQAMGGESLADNILLANALILDDGIEDVSSPNWSLEETEDYTTILYKKVLEEIESLPELYRNIMTDRELNGMKYEEISEKYQIELNTVKTRIKRARDKICKVALESITYED